MVCKEDVELWFRELSGHKRIDVMCSLLDKCLPFELRFFGTCLEDLGKQHFNTIKDFEDKANNPTELTDLLVQCIISDTRTRQKLALYICLVHSLNTTCSMTVYKTLSTLDISQIIPITKKADENRLEELLLIYTIAVNHPVFSFEQKTTLGNILLLLRHEEDRLHTLSRVSSEDYVNTNLHISSNNRHSDPSNARNDGPPIVPTGFTGNYIQLTPNPPFGTTVVWQQIPLETITMCQDVPGTTTTTTSSNVHYSSPHISRHSSPSQSASPSRTASPVRKNYYNKIDKSQMSSHGKTNKMNHVERFDGTEHGPKSDDELGGVLENKVAELSINDNVTHKSPVVSLNGVCENDIVEYVPIIAQGPITHPHNGLFYNCIANIPRSSVASLMGNQQQPVLPKKSGFISQPAVRSGLVHPYGGKDLSLDNENSRHFSSGSSSDGSSASHSPPSTPANPSLNWEKGSVDCTSDKSTRGPENADSLSDDTGHVNIVQKPERTPSNNNRVFPIARGRGRSPHSVQTLPRARGPPSTFVIDGVQKNMNSCRRDGPRSAPPTPHDDKKSYLLSSSEPVTAVTVTGPPQSSLTSVSVSKPPPLSQQQQQQQQQQAAAAAPTPAEIVSTGVPFNQQFIQTHYPPVYSAYPPPPPPATFVRPPNFTFPNGEVMFSFAQGQPPPPQAQFVSAPTIVPYSTSVPPPKLSCFNCSSQTHHANDCKEPTMEEYCSKGQYRIDYKPYNKQGECSMSDK